MKRAFLLLTVLLTLSMGGVAHAEDLNPNLAPSPLRQNEPVLEQMTQTVTQKQDALGGATDEIAQLLQKKQDLANQLADAQKDIADLNQKIADKKAAAEAEAKRVEELKNMFVHVVRYASGSAGNLYAPGNCTWYVKNRRPDLPNNLGNANTWYSMARADGYNVGSAPKKGAVGTTTAGWLGHVVYVEGVSLDGSTVTISEMNYAGLYSTRTRVAPASEFLYIYELN
jgi:surface antigen